MGDERQFACPGLTRDQHVVRADWRSVQREVRPDLAGLPGVLKSQRVEQNVARVDALQFSGLDFDESALVRLRSGIAHYSHG